MKQYEAVSSSLTSLGSNNKEAEKHRAIKTRRKLKALPITQKRKNFPAEEQIARDKTPFKNYTTQGLGVKLCLTAIFSYQTLRAC